MKYILRVLFTLTVLKSTLSCQWWEYASYESNNHLWSELTPLLFLRDQQTTMPMTASHFCLGILKSLSCMLSISTTMAKIFVWYWFNFVWTPWKPAWQWLPWWFCCAIGLFLWRYVNLHKAQWVKPRSDRLRSSGPVNLVYVCIYENLMCI